VVYPDLVLTRVAARRVHLVERREAGRDEPLLRREDVLGRLHLDARVVERTEILALPLRQREVERRLGDRELRVTRLVLLGRDAEQRLVERDRPLDVGDGER